MAWLVGVLLLSAYAGLVVSVVFRMNQCGVLDKRMWLALGIPLLHFIVLPLMFLLLEKEIKWMERLRILWFMVYMFPGILAVFCARLAEETAEIKSEDCGNDDSEVGMYRGVCLDVSEKRAYAY